MIKKNLKTLILTSVIILLPILLGLIFWSSLPSEIPTHWNAAGEIDRYSSKSFAVFALPMIMLVLHWLCAFFTHTDKKNANQDRKPMTMVFWICPIISIVLFGLMYAVAMGMDIAVNAIMPLILGVVFVVVGNYLPKCRQNYTIGIKLPWTFQSEENWNKTHRFGGKLMVLAGFLLMLSVLLPENWSVWCILIILAIWVLAITVYSYGLSRKQ